ncbi:MAG: hypothetical protein GEU28_06100 [Dehalococcoidia bacterium]|nr:hypothetical protein [Dehalococcoidia bacterium]
MSRDWCSSPTRGRARTDLSSPEMANPFVLDFSDPCAGDQSLTGGKGSHLAELTAAGFPVPRGLVLTTAAYRRFVSEGPGGEEQEPRVGDEPIGGASRPEVLRERLSRDELPPDLAAAVLEALRAWGHVGPLAVRSSAVSEDSAASSFAGLYQSYLNVRGERDLLARVRDCFASLWSEPAVRYRDSRRLDHSREAMAVVVMEMVEACSAGVAFTVHPVTGARDQIVINSAWGLGEAVVAGVVTPDMFVVDKSSLAVLERQVFDKQFAIGPDAVGGTARHPLDDAISGAPSLSDQQVVDVARLAREVEEHYGASQDIEWACADRLYLLQARPVTMP